MKNFLSFDVEEWFVPLAPEPGNWNSYPSRIVEEVEHILDILERYRTRATFFILTQSVLGHPGLVKNIAKKRHEIASHGTGHHFVYNQTPRRFRAEVDESIGFLRRESDQEIVGYRAPYFSITRRSLWALPILEEAGLNAVRFRRLGPICWIAAQPSET
jgi:peptidoglycan/xylan/chitin deacetylase (PgdA/CDA1 family)